MNLVSKTFSAELRQFVDTNRSEFNTDLIDAFLEEAPWIEVQVNVRTDLGKSRQRDYTAPNGKQKTFTCRVHEGAEFYPIRYPHGSMDNPDWDTDPGLRYPLAAYVEEIGTTWFAKSGSRRVVYDVDAAFGHKNGGLTEAELRKIHEVCKPIEYIEMRRSTSGRGLHLHLLLSGIKVENHTQHAAIARCLLAKICEDAGLEFSSQIDCMGGNIWFWSRRATHENRGFECLKRASRVITPDDLPANWQEHVAVVARRRSRIRVLGWPEDEESGFAELASTFTRVPMDDEHKRIFGAYAKTGFSLVPNPDFGCWYMHTVGLAKVHESLGLKGHFDTQSKGNDPGTPNCYVFLRPRGVLFVALFKSQNECPSWGTTEKGERCCYYNSPLDLHTACEIVGGIWKGSKGATCPDLATAKRFAALFGYSLPPLAGDRPINFRHENAYTIVAETEQVKGEIVHGWGIDYRKLIVTFETEPAPESQHDYDSVARHVVTTERENAGYLMRTSSGIWNWEPKDTVKDLLKAKYGLDHGELTCAIATVAANPYTLVNEPFQPEFLAGRKWNKFGAQLTVAPTHGRHHPHFDMILEHNGRGLDDAVKEDPWCRRHNVQDGRHFLMLWAASMFQRPTQRLPMLYFFSPERDNGKSSFHRALGLSFASGYVEGTRMLNEQFNKAMAEAVLVYLDEEKVADKAAQKVKQYIEFGSIPIRMMRTDTFQFPNTSHWIACYNYADGVPVENGDERIIMVRVPLLYDDEKLKWDEEMLPALENEKSDFLGTLMGMELPPAATRLYLPVLLTDLKREVMEANAKADKPSCDLDELFKRLVQIMNTQELFTGRSRDLQDVLGQGSWSTSPNHLRRYLRSIEDRLQAASLSLDLSDERRIVIQKRQ